MPDAGHSLEEGDFPGIGSGGLFGLCFLLRSIVECPPEGESCRCIKGAATNQTDANLNTVLSPIFLRSDEHAA